MAAKQLKANRHRVVNNDIADSDAIATSAVAAEATDSKHDAIMIAEMVVDPTPEDAVVGRAQDLGRAHKAKKIRQ